VCFGDWECLGEGDCLGTGELFGDGECFGDADDCCGKGKDACCSSSVGDPCLGDELVIFAVGDPGFGDGVFLGDGL